MLSSPSRITKSSVLESPSRKTWSPASTVRTSAAMQSAAISAESRPARKGIFLRSAASRLVSSLMVLSPLRAGPERFLRVTAGACPVGHGGIMARHRAGVERVRLPSPD
jgi:hypothetical protein